jgi:hypothetical protein
MKPIMLVGVVLIVAGIVGLGVANISFTEQKTVLDAGPIKITTAEQHTIPVPTIAGIAAIIVGLGLCFIGRARA